MRVIWNAFALVGAISLCLTVAGALGIGHFVYYYGAKPMCAQGEKP